LKFLNHDLDDTVNITMVNFSSNFTYRQPRLIYHAYNCNRDKIQAIALFTIISN